MAEPTFRSKTSLAAGNQSNGITLTVPAGVVAGDLLIAVMAIYPPDPEAMAATPPTGWTKKYLVQHSTALETLAWYYKIAGSSDAAGAGSLTYRFDFANNTNVRYGQGDMYAFANPSTAGDPFEAFAYTDPNEAVTSGNYPAVSTTSLHDGALVLWFGMGGDGTVTAPSGFTGRSTTGAVSLATKTQTTAGATGSITSTCSSAAGHPSAALAVLAASGGAAALSVTATAGSTSILTTDTTTLTGTATGGSGTKTYAWTKTSGPAVTLSSTSSATPTFTPTGGAGSYVMRCTVTDTSGSAYGEVTITVSEPSSYATLASVDVATSWTASSGTALSCVTDNDGTTFVTSSDSPSALEFTGTLGALTPPAGDLTVLVDMDRINASSGTVDAYLFEGATQRSSVTGLSIPAGSGSSVSTQAVVTFPAADVAAVTSWSSLTVKLFVTAS